MVCAGIYAVLIQTVSFTTEHHRLPVGSYGIHDPSCVYIFKTGAVAKSIFHAH